MNFVAQLTNNDFTLIFVNGDLCVDITHHVRRKVFSTHHGKDAGALLDSHLTGR